MLTDGCEERVAPTRENLFVVVSREAPSTRESKGRTVTTVTKTEGGKCWLREGRGSASATVHVNEASHWDALHATSICGQL